MKPSPLTLSSLSSPTSPSSRLPAMTRPVRLVFCQASVAAACAVLCALASAAEPTAGEAAPPLVAMSGLPSRTPSANALDERYASLLHDQVAAAVKYPNSREARQLQPQGRVEVSIELDRSGRLVDSGVTSGSGQRLLDVEALRSVRHGRYAAFPAGAFGSEPSHRFAVTLEYLPAQP